MMGINEMKKPKTQHKAKTSLLELSNSLEWPDFVSQLQIEISNTLYPTLAVIDYSVFKITFSIWSHVTNPLPLTNEDRYKYMIRNAMKIKKDPSVKIIVTEQPRKVSTHSLTCSMSSNGQWYRKEREHQTHKTKKMKI